MERKPRGEPISPNRIFKIVRLSHELSEEETVDICRLGGLEISKSRAKGWQSSVESRKFYPMNWDELDAFLDGLLIWINEIEEK